MVLFVDVTIPYDENIEKDEISKYVLDLSYEFGQIWEMELPNIIPRVIFTSGFIPKTLKKYLERLDNTPDSSFQDFQLTEMPILKKNHRSNACGYNTSQWSQFLILFLRALKILIRDHSSTWSRMLISLLVSLLIGTLFYDIGSDAGYVFNNFRFLCISCMFTMFTAFSSATVKFPLELPTVRREHFNRWYSSGAYFSSSLLASLPLQALSASIYTVPAYYMTGQPIEVNRISCFILILTMVALVGGSLGLLNGATFDIKHGMICGCFFIAPWVVFSGIFIRKRDAFPLLQWIFTISYLRQGLTGLCAALFIGRGKIKCESGKADEINFCPFSDPEFLMKELDIPIEKIYVTVLYMGLTFLVINLSSFIIFKLRLKYKR